MIDQIKAAMDDDRGVSPVIGVILMVAITVILAAVIGTFVLGLGDSLQQAPQSQLDASSGSANSVNVSHNGGDALPGSDVDVLIGDQRIALSNSSDVSGEFQVGDTAEFVGGTTDGLSTIPSGEVRVRLIHSPSESVLMDTTVDVPS